MSEIMSVARFRIQPGKAEEFKSLAAECIRIVRERDPATSLYEWFMNHDETECIAIDRYASSEAVFAHIANVGPTMRSLRKLADVSVELLGSPSAALVQALQFKSTEVYTRLAGLS